MPVGAAILIALTSSAAGALAATWVARMRINFEREESLRGRMLDAADDFSASVTRASNALHRLLTVVPEDDLRDESGNIDYRGEEVAKLNEALDASRPLVDEARAHFTRVRLLFGTATPAGQAALSVIASLSHTLQVLDDFEIRYAQKPFKEASLAHETFTREARRAVLQPSLLDSEDPPKPKEAELTVAELGYDAQGDPPF